MKSKILIFLLLAHSVLANELCQNLVQTSLPAELEKRLEVLAPVFLKIRTDVNAARDLNEMFSAQINDIMKNFPEQKANVQNYLKNYLLEHQSQAFKKTEEKKIQEQVRKKSILANIDLVANERRRSAPASAGSVHEYFNRYQFVPNRGAYLISQKFSMSVYLDYSNSRLVFENLRSGEKIVQKSKEDANRPYSELRMSPDERYISVMNSKFLEVTDLSTMNEVLRVEVGDMAPILWSPDSQFIYTPADGENATYQLHNVKTGKKVFSKWAKTAVSQRFNKSGDEFYWQDRGVVHVASFDKSSGKWSDGLTIKSGSSWSIHDMVEDGAGAYIIATAKTFRLDRPPYDGFEVKLHKVSKRDSKLLNLVLSKSLSSTTEIQKIDLSGEMAEHNLSQGQRMQLLSQGKILLVELKSGWTTFDVQTGQRIQALNTRSVPVLSENHVFFADPKASLLVNSQTGQIEKTVDAASFGKFSGDGQSLVTVFDSKSSDGVVLQVYNAQSFKSRLKMNTENHFFSDFGITNDGKILHMGSGLDEVRVWDLVPYDSP